MCQCPLVHVMTCASDFRPSVSLKRPTGGEPLETFSPDELAEFGGWVCRFRHVTWLFHEWLAVPVPVWICFIWFYIHALFMQMWLPSKDQISSACGLWGSHLSKWFHIFIWLPVSKSLLLRHCKASSWASVCVFCSSGAQVRVIERSTEGLHSIVKRTLARAPAASLSYLSR